MNEIVERVAREIYESDLIWIGNILLPRGIVFGAMAAVAIAIIGWFVILTDR